MAKEKFIKYHIWNSLRPYGEASHDNVMKYFKSTGTYYYEFLNKGLTAKQSYKLSLRKQTKTFKRNILQISMTSIILDCDIDNVIFRTYKYDYRFNWI